VLPEEDDSVIETCRSVLSVLMYILNFLNLYIYIYMCVCVCVCALVGVCTLHKLQNARCNDKDLCSLINGKGIMAQ